MRSWIEVDRQTTRVTTEVRRERFSYIGDEPVFPDFLAPPAGAESKDKKTEFTVNVALSLSLKEARDLNVFLDDLGFYYEEDSGAPVASLGLLTEELGTTLRKAVEKEAELNAAVK